MKILIVEDNQSVAQFLKKGLIEAGHTVDHADNGRDGIFFAATEHYDVIILDRMLPNGVDGIHIVQTLRKENNKTPVLILSALDGVDDRILGLQSGSDDYLSKPFSFGELMARIDAVIRRTTDTPLVTSLSLGDLNMNLLSHKVMRGAKVLELQPREFKLLEFLMRHSNQVVTRTMLLENIWNYHFDPQTNVIDVHISKLRQKIDGHAPTQLLRTIRNAGYMITNEA